MFSSRWLFVGIYRAPGPYVKYRENICIFVKYRCFFSYSRQFTVFPSPTPNLVKRVEYKQNDTTFEQKSSVLSCFLRADYSSVFTVILHHAWNIDKTLTFWQKSDWIFLTHSVFSCFPCAAKTSLFTVLPRPTQNIEKTPALWHKIAYFCIKV